MKKEQVVRLADAKSGMDTGRLYGKARAAERDLSWTWIKRVFMLSISKSRLILKSRRFMENY